MDEATKVEGHLSSAAAFVEGGIQEACDDSCSICLEPFSESDPSTVTGCKHEFHLQCILEWCQRSSQCPMCWQGIILKDPLSQELLEAVQQERSFNLNQSRNTAIFHHPALGDFELPLGSSDAELEERIIQHLAAAAAMGRARRMARREGQRRPATHHHPGQGHPQLFVFSTHSAGALAGEATSDSQNHCRNHDHNRAPAFSAAADSNNYDDNRGGAAPLSSGIPLRLGGQDESSSSQQQTVRTSLLEQDNNSMAPSTPPPANESGPSSNWYLARQSPAPENANQEGAGPPDLQSLSDSIKSRWNAVSLRCKDSITKTARGWRERFFARSSSVSSSSTLDLVSEERREVSTMITPNVPPMAEVPALREDSDRRSDPPLPMPAPPPTEDMAGILEHPEAAMTGQTGETCPSDGPVAAVSASSSSHR